MSQSGRGEAAAPLVGALLVGGESARFGSPKQLAIWRGASLAEHVAAALEAVTSELVAVGGGALPPSLASIERLADAGPTRGPLAGVLGALEARPGAAILAAACDQPRLTSEALAWLVAQRRPGAIAVVARRDAGGIEPVPGLFEPTSRAVLAELSATGGSLQRLAERSDVVVAPLPEQLATAWTSVDRPSDLESLDPPTPI